MKYSIAQSRQAVEHLIAMAESNKWLYPGSILDGAKQAALTLSWLERRAELMKALDRLERERPDLVDLFEAFPGSQIADVREAS